jgi:hypothetical protein
VVNAQRDRICTPIGNELPHSGHHALSATPHSVMPTGHRMQQAIIIGP